MKNKNHLYWILLAISVLTALSGLGQMLLPGLVLKVLSVQLTPPTQHFFGIIGMFMLLFGGVLTHALLSPLDQPIVVLWAGLQKFGASVAVGLGVMHAIFSPLALLVAGFDFLSGVLVLCYWRQLRQTGTRI